MQNYSVNDQNFDYKILKTTLAYKDQFLSAATAKHIGVTAMYILEDQLQRNSGIFHLNLESQT